MPLPVYDTNDDDDDNDKNHGDKDHDGHNDGYDDEIQVIDIRFLTR